jgi:hypothetical protein
MFHVPGATPAKFGLAADGPGEPISTGRPGTAQAEMIVKLPRWSDGSPVAGAPKNQD